MAFPFIPRDAAPKPPPEPREQLPQDFEALEHDQLQIKVKCQVCGTLAVRKQYGDMGWIHEGDEVILTTGPDPTVRTSFDHEVVLDVIEARVVGR